VIESNLEAEIRPSDNLIETQRLSLDSSQTSDIGEVNIDIPALVLNDLASESTTGEIKVKIQSKEASAEQKTNTARGSKFLIGFDIFEIDIDAGQGSVKELSSPITLSFDISQVNYSEDLKVHSFNETTKLWELAGNGGAIDNGKLIVTIDHLTIFGLLFTIAAAQAEEMVDERILQMHKIYSEAEVVFESGSSLETIINHNNTAMDVVAQQNGMEKYTSPIASDFPDILVSTLYAINNFIVYGTETTQILGAGERAGVVNSYKKAFNKLPNSEEEWKDCIAIGNGRWPGETSALAEAKAKEEFKNIYLREADMNQANDNAAVTVISYGLRPNNRNMDSEAAAIKIFRGIYKYSPTSALDWDIVRAIAYSGATR